MKLAEDLAGPIGPAIITIKKRKLQWFGHVIRHQSLAETIMLGWVHGSRKVGRHRTMWCGNVNVSCFLWSFEVAIRSAEDRWKWRKIIRTSFKLPDGPRCGPRDE